MTHSPARRRPRPRTTVRRLPDKQVHDVAARDAVLDQGLIAHVAVAEDGQPYVVPLAYARDGERLLVHGSTASRTLRSLGDGASTCVTVTVVDGIVIARSQFESSMRYRSVMMLGRFSRLHGEDQEAGLAVLARRLLPGLEGARPPAAKELAATMVLALPLTEWSLKVSAGHPEDDPADLDRPVWAGTVPLHHTWGTPEPAPDLAPGIEVPAALRHWPAGRT